MLTHYLLVDLLSSNYSWCISREWTTIWTLWRC